MDFYITIASRNTDGKVSSWRLEIKKTSGDNIGCRLTLDRKEMEELAGVINRSLESVY